MSEKTMQFITELKNYKSQREGAIQNKRNQLQQIKEQYNSKLQEISDTEKEYKLNFDDSVFEKLVSLKSEADKLKADMDKMELQVSFMNVGQLTLDNNEIEKQINEYVDSFKLDQLKNNILKAKQTYIDSINKFKEATEEMQNTRFQTNNLNNIINQSNKKPIARALNKRSKDFYLDDGHFIREYDVDILKRYISQQGYNITKIFEGTNGY